MQKINLGYDIEQVLKFRAGRNFQRYMICLKMHRKLLKIRHELEQKTAMNLEDGTARGKDMYYNSNIMTERSRKDNNENTIFSYLKKL